MELMKYKLKYSELSKDLLFYSILGIIDKITPFLILNIAIFFLMMKKLVNTPYY